VSDRLCPAGHFGLEGRRRGGVRQTAAQRRRSALRVNDDVADTDRCAAAAWGF
jgi:hypothetical protein